MRIWRANDGRHVPDGHPDAAFLAYVDGDEIPAGVLDEVAGKPDRKARRKPADKAVKAPGGDKNADDDDTGR